MSLAIADLSRVQLKPRDTILIPFQQITFELTYSPWTAGGKHWEVVAENPLVGFRRDELMRRIAELYKREFEEARKESEKEALARMTSRAWKRAAKVSSAIVVLRCQCKGVADPEHLEQLYGVDSTLPDVSEKAFDSLWLDSPAEFDPESRILKPRVHQSAA